MTEEQAGVVDEATDEAVEEQGLSLRDGAGDGSIDPANPPKVYEQLREYVRKLPCLACQRDNGMVGDAFDFVPRLDRQCDPHHVKTRGSGGHDAENLVPLCTKHHSEVGSISDTQFQIKYNLDLRQLAIDVYQAFLKSDEIQDVASKTFALHQRIVARIDDAKRAMMIVANEILEFVDTKYDGRPAYVILGFSSAEAYFTTPVEAGGLGLKQRTAWRMLAMARVKEELGGDQDIARQLGTYKSEIVLPHIRAESDPVKRREMATAVAAMPVEDARSWSAKRQGLPDRRQQKHDVVMVILDEYLRSIGADMSNIEGLDGVAWKIVSTCAKA